MKRISVLVPYYNHPSYVRDCIESIWRQADLELEIILIDDGSPNDSQQGFERLLALKAESPVPMTVIRQENVGLVPTLNRLLKLATGDFICLLASDDMYLDGALPALYAAIVDDNIAVVYGNGRFLENGRIALHKEVHHSYIKSRMYGSSEDVLAWLLSEVPRPLLTQCAIYRKSLLDAIGGWDEEVLLDDWPLNIRIFQYLVNQGLQHRFLDSPVVLYRQHDANTHSDRYGMYVRIRQVIDKYIPDGSVKKILSLHNFNFGLTLLRRTPLAGLRMIASAFWLHPSPDKFLLFGEVAVSKTGKWASQRRGQRT